MSWVFEGRWVKETLIGSVASDIFKVFLTIALLICYTLNAHIKILWVGDQNHTLNCEGLVCTCPTIFITLIFFLLFQMSTFYFIPIFMRWFLMRYNIGKSFNFPRDFFFYLLTSVCNISTDCLCWNTQFYHENTISIVELNVKSWLIAEFSGY